MLAKSVAWRSGDREAVGQQVERLVASPALQHSEALCQLLRYLVTQTLDRPEEHVKEYQIALDVLGRRDSFDPRLDSAVRVQTSRLRTKLIEYYATDGANDPVHIDIPKGNYSAVFQFRKATPTPEPAPSTGEFAAAPVIAPAAPVPKPGRRRVAAIIVGAAVVAVIALLLIRASLPVKPLPSPTRDPVVAFWMGFLDSTAVPLIIFSNAEFVGRPETGLRYFAPGRDQPEAVFDHYTGVGEVISTHELDQVFARLNRPVQVKRGRILSGDDAANLSVVVLGSPSENLSLRDLKMGREFRFQTWQQPPREGDLGIVNLHPASGEQPVYFGSRSLPITEDYALVELARGVAPANSILMLAGTTTFGTQAAVEFVCNAGNVGKLLPSVQRGGALRPFTALLRTKVNRGVPIETTLVALRVGKD
jgi:hypothetical protein